MLSSTSKITCKCSHVLGASRRLPTASLQIHHLQATGRAAPVLRLARLFSGSRANASISSHSAVTSKTSQEGQQVPPPASGINLKWDLYAGVVLERKPQLTQEASSIEKEYAELLAKYELELSKKSDHEVRKEKEKILMEKIKSGEIDSDQASASTAQDQEDLWASELQQFTFGSRKTEADKKNDQKSLDRARDSHLMLVIEQKIGNDYKWICPHGKWVEGETMRQTAERTLKDVCPEVKAKVLGNAPWGFYKYKYPKGAKELSSVGAKVFFYKAQLVSGSGTIGLHKKESPKDNNPPSIEVKDYLWLTREELESKLQPAYLNNISLFLVNEKN